MRKKTIAGVAVGLLALVGCHPLATPRLTQHPRHPRDTTTEEPTPTSVFVCAPYPAPECFGGTVPN